MKKKLLFLLILSITFISCNSQNMEVTEQQIKNFCQHYYEKKSNVQAKNLKAVNIEDLSYFYNGNDISFSPAPHINKKYWIVDDQIFMSKNEIVKINGKNTYREKIEGKFYDVVIYNVTLTIKYKGYYLISDNDATFYKDEKETITSFWLDSFDGKMKIYADNTLPHFNIRESDVPLLLESIKKQKK